MALALFKTKRYLLDFGHAATGTPTWVSYKRLDTLADLTQPTIVALGNGLYRFDVDWHIDGDSWPFLYDPDIVYEVGLSGSYLAGKLSMYDEGLVHQYINERNSWPTFPIPDGSYTIGLGQMIQAVGGRVDQLKADILGYEQAGEGSAFGPTTLELAGGGTTEFGGLVYDQDVNSLKYISEHLGGGGVDLELRAMVQRALGMLHENSVLDNTTYIGVNLASGRLRLYDSAANATAARAASQQVPPVEYDTGLIARYAINAAYTGANLKDYVVTLEFLQPTP
jgi:hypothetical protein